MFKVNNFYKFLIIVIFSIWGEHISAMQAKLPDDFYTNPSNYFEAKQKEFQNLATSLSQRKLGSKDFQKAVEDNNELKEALKEANVEKLLHPVEQIGFKGDNELADLYMETINKKAALGKYDNAYFSKLYSSLSKLAELASETLKEKGPIQKPVQGPTMAPSVQPAKPIETAKPEVKVSAEVAKPAEVKKEAEVKSTTEYFGAKAEEFEKKAKKYKDMIESHYIKVSKADFEKAVADKKELDEKYKEANIKSLALDAGKMNEEHQASMALFYLEMGTNFEDLAKKTNFNENDVYSLYKLYDALAKKAKIAQEILKKPKEEESPEVARWKALAEEYSSKAAIAKPVYAMESLQSDLQNLRQISFNFPSGLRNPQAFREFEDHRVNAQDAFNEKDYSKAWDESRKAYTSASTVAYQIANKLKYSGAR
jgi:hypothetical protein